MANSNQQLLLLWLICNIPMLLGEWQPQLITKPHRHKYHAAAGSIVRFIRSSANVIARQKLSGSKKINGRPLQLTDVRSMNVAYNLTANSMYYLTPEAYHPKCSQIIVTAVWNNQVCQLPPSCGITKETNLDHGWFSSSIACTSMFTDQLPNSTVDNFSIKHDKHWAQAYNIVLPKAYKNYAATLAISEHSMLHYMDGTFQLVAKVLLANLANYNDSNGQWNEPVNTQQGKYLCYHRPILSQRLYYARKESPDEALAVAGLLLDDTPFCPLHLQWVVQSNMTCKVDSDSNGCGYDCYQEQLFECDTTRDNYSPPGYIQSHLLGLFMWSVDLLSHSLTIMYTQIIKCLSQIWSMLNVYIMVNEYLILLLISTVITRNIYAGLAIIALVSTILGVYRY